MRFSKVDLLTFFSYEKFLNLFLTPYFSDSLGQTKQGKAKSWLAEFTVFCPRRHRSLQHKILYRESSDFILTFALQLLQSWSRKIRSRYQPYYGLEPTCCSRDAIAWDMTCTRDKKGQICLLNHSFCALLSLQHSLFTWCCSVIWQIHVWRSTRRDNVVNFTSVTVK